MCCILKDIIVILFLFGKYLDHNILSQRINVFPKRKCDLKHVISMLFTSVVLSKIVSIFTLADLYSLISELLFLLGTHLIFNTIFVPYINSIKKSLLKQGAKIIYLFYNCYQPSKHNYYSIINKNCTDQIWDTYQINIFLNFCLSVCLSVPVSLRNR